MTRLGTWFVLSLTALIGTLGVAPAAADPPLDLRGPGVIPPAPVIFIVDDNSLSMDFTETIWEHPDWPTTCSPQTEEYERTRQVISWESLTGTFQNYCPTQVLRTATYTNRDNYAAGILEHTAASYTRQRRDGLLDVYGDQFYFGLATFDTLINTSATSDAGDWSYGPNRGTPTSLNLGIANRNAPTGGLITGLPPGWLPSTPGAVDAFRIQNSARIQATVRAIVPGGGTPIAAALDDVQYWRHFDAGLRSDPFAACREVYSVLITDGEDYWDYPRSPATTGPAYCQGQSDSSDTYRRCTSYRSTSGYRSATGQLTSSLEASDLANGTNCAACTSAGITTRGVPTYVIGFSTDNPTAAETVATAAGTCALMDEDGACLQHAFGAEAQAEVLYALGTIFNRTQSGDVSLTPPLTSTVSLAEGIGRVQFRAGTEISQRSPHWTGTLDRSIVSCQDVELPEGGTIRAFVPGETVSLEEQFTPELVPERRIYTARLDVARTGASCERPTCPIGSASCYEVGAVPDPGSNTTLVGFGDGTGGPTRGGNTPSALAAVGGSTCSGEAYSACITGCGSNTGCQAECQTFYNCGAAYQPGILECVTGYLDTCVLSCLLGQLLNPITATEAQRAACTCGCQNIFDCGACGNPAAAPVTSDIRSRATINQNLQNQRLQGALRGNDDPLPTLPTTTWSNLETSTDSCLIPFDVDTFVDARDLSDVLYAQDATEAERIIRFARGETLTALSDAGLLNDMFDPETVALYDRAEDEYVGDFYHSQMAMSNPPFPWDQPTAGWREFVNEVGVFAANPRPNVVYVGANDGMLHAFDAVSGEELWAIIPPSLLPQLAQTTISHRVMVDGAVEVEDLRCSMDATHEEWCTLLAVSYRGGGSGAMVLDVTDPLEPRFLYEVTGQQIGELGFGFSRPLLGNMSIRGELRPVLILTGGRPLGGPTMVIGNQARGSSEGEVIVVLDALTGEIYRQFDPVSHPALFATCGPVTGSPGAWSQTQFTRIFAGTEYGCLLRVDASEQDPLDWSMEALYQTESKGEIDFAPAIARRTDGSLVVLFGHGTLDDFEHVNQRANIVSLNEARDFIEGDEEEGTLGTFRLNGVTVNYEIQLETGEFLTAAPFISDGIAYFATWVPNHVNACAMGGSRVYGIDWLGDRSVDGPDNTAPHRVTIDSQRIMGEVSNPLYDPEDPDSEPIVSYVGPEVLGTGTIVSSMTVAPVPSCETTVALVDGEEREVPTGAGRRELMIDLLYRDDGEGGVELPEGSTAYDDEGETEVGSDDGESMTMINLEHDLPPSSRGGIYTDWGVILEF